MDIKIDAVFSLANDGVHDSNDSLHKESDSDTTKKEPESNRLTIKEEVNDPGYDRAEFNSDYTGYERTLMCIKQERDTHDRASDTDSSPENDTKPFNAGDMPPALSIERGYGVLQAMLYDRRRESMPPPVLVPQTPYVTETSKNIDGNDTQPAKGNKKKCMKIFPCYIVLTKVDKYLRSDGKCSGRTLRKTYRECPNICKNVYFRCNLKAGKDVFNVKAPSKLKGYQEYIQMHGNKKKGLSKPKTSPGNDVAKLRELMEKYKRSTVKGGAGRVMRSVHYFPKDFMKGLKRNYKSPAVVKFISEARQQVLDETEKEITQKRELAKLKNQIAFKRSESKAKREYRRLQSENAPFYFKSGTSGVSGRVRKVNNRYGNDYARNKDEVQYFRSLSMIHEKMKRGTKKMKKEVIDDKSGERTKKFEVVIDNAEAANENSSNVVKKRKTYSDLSQEERDRINAQRREISRRKKLENVQKKMLDESKDGVIIKDMPNEYDVLTDLLLSNDPNTDNVEEPEKMHTEIDGAFTQNTFAFAKSTLKRSADSGHETYDDEADSSGLNGESTMDEERAKLLRIPDKVRKLFVKNKSVRSGGDSATATNKYSTTGITMEGTTRKVAGPSCVPNIIKTNSLTNFGDKPKFVITTSGLVKPILPFSGGKQEGGSGVCTQGTKLKIARKLLSDAVSKSQTDIEVTVPTQEINELPVPRQVVSVPTVERLQPVGLPASYPVTTQSHTMTTPQPKWITHVPGDVTLKPTTDNQPGQLSVQLTNAGNQGTNPPLATLGQSEVTQSGQNLFYQFEMSGKKFLVSVNPSPSQQKVVTNNDMKEAATPVVTTNWHFINVNPPYNTEAHSNKSTVVTPAGYKPQIHDQATHFPKISQAVTSVTTEPHTIKYVSVPVNKDVTFGSGGEGVDSKKVIRVYAGGIPQKLPGPVTNSQTAFTQNNPNVLPQSLLNTQGKRMTLVPSSIPQQVSGKSLLAGNTPSISQVRYLLIPAPNSANAMQVTTTGNTAPVYSTTTSAVRLATTTSNSLPKPTVISIPASSPNDTVTCINAAASSKNASKVTLKPILQNVVQDKDKTACGGKAGSSTGLTKYTKKETVPEKPIPFAEATSAREEKLKRLKALLKEKQMAVEKLRQNKLNIDTELEMLKELQNKVENILEKGDTVKLR